VIGLHVGRVVPKRIVFAGEMGRIDGKMPRPFDAVTDWPSRLSGSPSLRLEIGLCCSTFAGILRPLFQEASFDHRFDVLELENTEGKRVFAPGEGLSETS
jgi:hypothetical protein